MEILRISIDWRHLLPLFVYEYCRLNEEIETDRNTCEAKLLYYLLSRDFPQLDERINQIFSSSIFYSFSRTQVSLSMHWSMWWPLQWTALFDFLFNGYVIVRYWKKPDGILFTLKLCSICMASWSRSWLCKRNDNHHVFFLSHLITLRHGDDASIDWWSVSVIH